MERFEKERNKELGEQRERREEEKDQKVDSISGEKYCFCSLCGNDNFVLQHSYSLLDKYISNMG